MTRDKTSAGAFLVALATVFAALALLAGPASADTGPTSGSARADNSSVASGSAQASNQSTASGDSVARNQSTASGCSTATNQSTASGEECGPTPPTTRATPPTTAKAGTATGGASTATGGASTAAGAATASTAKLALTGSWSAPLAAMAALAIALGLWLLVAAGQRRPSHIA